MIYVFFIAAGLFLGFAFEQNEPVLAAICGFLVAYILESRRKTKRGFRDLDDKIARLEQNLLNIRIQQKYGAPAPRESVPVEAAAPVSPPPLPEPEMPLAPSVTPDVVAYSQPLEDLSEPDQVPMREPLTPAPPSGLQVFLEDVRNVVLGGNTLARVGVLILIIGLGLLAKYAAQQQLFPIEARLASMMLVGAALVGFGWGLRNKRFGYASALQGGGVGIMYLCIFFALRPYEIIPAGMAAILLIGVAVTGSVLAVVQSSLALAVIATVGGFLAPVLASTGKGNHVALFSYYALLNCAIFVIAWFRAWRPLNLLGFACTFGIGTAWGILKYEPAQFATTEPFLVLFFLIYTAIPILYAQRQDVKLRGIVDGSLIFGTPLVVYSLQTPLVLPYELGLAYSSLALGVFYVTLVTFMLRHGREEMRDMAQAFLALGIGFATLTIPQALDDQHFTAAVWALEGAGILWIGVRQQRFLPRLSGIALQFAGGAAFLYQGSAKGAIPIANSEFLGAAILAGTGLFAAITLHRGRETLKQQELVLAPAFLVWAVLWWTGAVSEEVADQVVRIYRMPVTLGIAALSALGLEWLGTRIAWHGVRWAGFTLFPVTLLGILHLWIQARHPVAGGGFVGWPLAIAAQLALLRRNDGLLRKRIENWFHAFTYWSVVILLLDEASWAVRNLAELGSVWQRGVAGTLLALSLAVLPQLSRKVAWPFARHREAYLQLTGKSLAVVALLWTLVLNFSGRAAPWPLAYVPVLNPVELPVLLIVAAILGWYGRARGSFEELTRPVVQQVLASALGLTLFAWINVLALRCIHHWVGVPYHFDLLYRSGTVQTTVSILWTLVAFSLMIYATRQAARPVWVIGASLLAVVVVKLFAIDLSNTAMTGRIVSFVAVGALLLLIGYVAPVPPAAAAPQSDSLPAGEETGKEPA